ncbi:VTT domain-containing protein [Clostridium sp. MSJ-11]|uniref:TVP38/TMEM64 family membrane protein n=1 Tax=Clostridium mobile TaxID=2841512 RepID=A0ABS6EI03_9CLOT|nr:VTT domain-containing protein [Clostridium mobile]MBU5484029.1 VTT domain-containing protein [Clostridium mobile]
MKKAKELLNRYKSIIILIMTLLFFIALGYIFRKELEHIFNMLRDQKQIKEFITSFGPLSKIVFIILQIIQVVIFIIPGEITQAAGGYIFGTVRGTILSIIGINIGAVILFLLTKKYKEKLVDKLIPNGIKTKFQKILNCKKINLIVFLIYLLPGIPKDVLTFLCGLSKISLKDFILYSTLGRMPALIMSCYYGQSLALGNKSMIIIGTIIILVVFLIGVIFKETIVKSLEKVN